MKPYLYLLPLLLLSCKNEPAKAPLVNTPASTQTAKQPEASAATQSIKRPIDMLYDFNGDGKNDIDGMVMQERGQKLIISFANKDIPKIHLRTGNAIPVGEGDLNGDGAAELTLAAEPNHGCTYDITTWSLQGGKWKQVFGPELFPTACETINADSVDSLIVKENGKVYFYKTDVNDEDFKKVKTEIHLK